MGLKLVQVWRWPVLVAAIAVALAVAPIARADQASDAVALVQQVHQTALDLDRGGAAADLAKEAAAIRAAFDGTAIGQVVLGKYWASASASDRAAFVDALLDAIVQGLADRLSGSQNLPFDILATQMLTNGDILVRTQFNRPVRQPVPVDWRVHHCQTKLCIADVAVSGASVSLQRRDDAMAQLAASGGSIPALIATLRQNQASLIP
jgi:phospholipid transport system substrate-binding protein